MSIVRTDVLDSLSNDSIKQQTSSKQIERRLRWEQGQFSLIYDPRWRLIGGTEEDAVILRFIEEGQLLAQCNIIEVPPRPADKPLKLSEFNAEVQRMSSQNDTVKVTGISEKKTHPGLTALRVQVDGVENEVPLRWIYYHVGAEDGRRLTFVFTLEKDVASRFSPYDLSLVNELVIRPIPGQSTRNSVSKKPKKELKRTR